MRNKNLYIRTTQNIHQVFDETAFEKSVPPHCLVKNIYIHIIFRGGGMAFCKTSWQQMEKNTHLAAGRAERTNFNVWETEFRSHIYSF